MITRKLVLSFAEDERTLASLLATTNLNDKCTAVGMQAPDDNTNPVYFGQPGACFGFLKQDKSVMLPLRDLKAIAFKKPADSTDYVVVHIFGNAII